MAFPLSPVPAHYRRCSFATRVGMFYQGSATVPSITLSASGPTAYEVRDYFGTVVSSGSVSGTVCTPTAPTGGWKPGWYRVYFTGAATDALFGPSHGATSFCVIRDDARFPPMPPLGTPTEHAFRNETADYAAKGVMGMGTSRLIINDAKTPTVSAGNDTIAYNLLDIQVAKDYWAAPTHAPYTDSARPRALWTNFNLSAVDSFKIPSTASFLDFARFYVKTLAIDGAQVFLAVTTGTTSGIKVTVSFPDAATVVETYDNLATNDPISAVAKINAASAYVVGYSGGNPAVVPSPIAPTAIGRAARDGVVQVVQAQYPDVKFYEGPSNEPPIGAEAAHQMRLFQAAVHAGNSGAKAMGPCPVNVSDLAGWRAFFAAGGGDYCDLISFHDYNSMTNGSLPQARASISAFKALLAEFGLSGKELWQTEAGAAFTAVYGVHHPRRARVKLLHTLMWEQNGVPRERNSYWYDMSHGFWSYPTWWKNGDQSFTPEVPLTRVLAEETFGRPFASALSFGFIGDRVFLGNVYTGTTGTTVALVATSHIPGATVTLTIGGTSSPVTVVDAFGNTSTATITDGRVTVPVGDVPTYVRLPVGATVAAYSCNDWPPVTSSSAWVSSGRSALGKVGGAGSGVLANDAWPASYGGSADADYASGTATTPDTAELAWPVATRVDRVIVWAGQAWQTKSTLIDFDVQTSLDGTTWTTRKTVTRPTPSSFQHGTDSSNVGCQRETYWDEQWVFDVKLDAPVTCKYLRLYVRATSYGGEPDAAAVAVGGQGDSVQRVVIQELAVLCDANTRKQYVVA